MSNPFIRKATSGAEFSDEIPPEGPHRAALVAIIELGTHSTQYGPKPQCFFVWQLAANREDGSPFYIGRQYTLSTDAKAKLRQVLEAWRRKKYADDETIDVTKYLGTGWLVSIGHEHKVKDGKDRTYAQIAALESLRRDLGEQPPTPAHAPFVYYIAADCPVPFPDAEWIPRCYGALVSDLIKSSPEWLALNPQAAKPAAQNGAPAPTRAPAQFRTGAAPAPAHPSASMIDSDEIPF